MRTRNETKKAAAHIWNSGLRPEILFKTYLVSRIDWKSSSQSSHRGHLLPGWQAAAFATAVPNAYRNWIKFGARSQDKRWKFQNFSERREI